MPRALFFFGTLRHIPLLEIVLGRVPPHETASLPGFQVSAVAEGPFPMIATDKAAIADGIVLRGLNDADVSRLDYYEGGFGYTLQTVTLSDGTQAETYLPQEGLWTSAGPWSLADWAAEWGEMSCHAAREVMGYMGQRSAEEVAQMFPVIRARAASRVRAEQAKHGAHTLYGNVEIRAQRRVYSDFFALDEITLSHARFDGTMSGDIERAVFVAADAAILLPYDPVRDQVLLVEQLRTGPLVRGDKAVWQLEPIAGRIDPGETPQDAARREALEEAGLIIHEIETIAEVYPTPGTSTEFYYIFMGLADIPHVSGQLGGLASEDEDIRSHVMSFHELMDLVTRFGVANAPLVTAAYWLSHHRDRLRLARGAGTPQGH